MASLGAKVTGSVNIILVLTLVIKAFEVMKNKDVIFSHPTSQTPCCVRPEDPGHPSVTVPSVGGHAFLWAKAQEWPVVPMAIRPLSQACVGTAFIC